MFVENRDLHSIVEYVSPLRGGSQPFLARANDGHLYVVKCIGNPQGPNVLFNECVGNELYRLCGLPVPSWKTLQLTPSFLKKNKACWPVENGNEFRPKAGICLGSRFLSESANLYEILPSSGFGRIQNRAIFWLAWLVDICAGHTDNRQALFLDQGKDGLDSVFIDHGHMFGGAFGTQVLHPAASRYLDFRVYDQLSSRCLRKFQQVVLSLDVDRLGHLVHTTPEEWKTESALKSIVECLNRLSNKDFVTRTVDAMAMHHRQIMEYRHDYPQVQRKTSEEILHSGLLCSGAPRAGKQKYYSTACNAA